MKTHLSPIVSAFRTVILIFAVTGFLAALASAQGQTSTNLPPIPPGFATRADYLKSLTKEKDILDAYHTGRISKDEAAMALSALGNGKSMDTYGKVVDQDGQPVVGAKVRAALERETSLTDDKEYDTKSDAKGLFHFLGLHGSALDIIPEKAGYDFDPKLPCSSRPEFYVPDPTNPLIVTMWKVHGAEPMVHDQKFYRINSDERTFTIDLMKNVKIAGTNTAGDFQIQIQRPAHIGRKDKFDWSFVMTAIDGGLIEATNDAYLNEAPDNGYQSQYKFSMSASEEKVIWSNWVKFERNFYLKSRGGKIYGHFHIVITPSYNDNDDTSALDIVYYINPAGSRNLEFDPQKQIH
jgi:hypothetical protein